MDSNPSLDRNSFEAFLANALEVQQSGLDARSLSAIIDVQRFLTTAEFNVDGALHLIAERAVKIANASGIAIALLESNQLVYRAGSGSAAVEIGRHVPAVLSARSEAQAEILRVEDAQNDSRVQAEICKQFGATSLLILPIYGQRDITGVLQVHFSEAHAFLDREVRAYRMMAGLVEDAMLRDLQHRTDKAPAAQTGAAAVIQRVAAAGQVLREEDKRPMPSPVKVSQPRQAPAVDWATDWARFGTESTRQFVEIVHRLFGYKIWPVAAGLGAGIVLAIAIRTAHDHYPVSSRIAPSAVIQNKTSEALLPSPLDAGGKVSNPNPNPKTKGEAAPSSAFRKIRVGPNEVDYVADDVTIRQFTRPARPQPRAGERRVDIGEDVTIRYFSNNSALESQVASQTAKQSSAKSH